jgi:hypothetical protein
VGKVFHRKTAYLDMVLRDAAKEKMSLDAWLEGDD